MRSYLQVAAVLGFALMAATPVLAQGAAEGAKPTPGSGQPPGTPAGTFDSSTGATKQHTQGLPAGTVPPEYGANASRKQQQSNKMQ